jgi:hypothetical protein
MKRALKILPLILILSMIISCGERKNAIDSSAGYSVVATMPPIGIFQHIYVTPTSDRGYISANYAGLLELDLSNPGNPSVLNILLNPTWMGSTKSSYVSQSTEFVYVETYSPGSNSGALRVFAMDSINTMTTKFFESGQVPFQKFQIQEITHDSLGNTIVDTILVYIADTQEVEKLNRRTFIRVLNDIFEEDTYAVKSYTEHPVYDFVLRDSLGFLALNEFGMGIIDLNYPGYFQIVGSFDTEGFCKGIDISGNYCYLADRHWGLQVIDISIPVSPQRIANLLFSGADDCEKVRVLGERAVVMDKYDGIFVVDISNPGAPKFLYNLDLVTPVSLELTADHIYVVDEDLGLVVVAWL